MAVSKALSGLDIPALGDDFQHAALDLPLYVAAITPDPLQHILAVKEHKRIRWRLTGLLPGPNDLRLRSPPVVYSPPGIGQHGRVFVTRRRFACLWFLYHHGLSSRL